MIADGLTADAPAEPQRAHRDERLASLVITNARLADGSIVDIDVDDQHVVAVRTSGATRSNPAGATVLDAESALVVAGFVEPHAHLDKALTADLVPNPTGDLVGAIRAWLSARPQFSRDDIHRRARAAALEHVLNGTTVIRTHVDTGADIGTRAVEAVIDVRDDLVDAVTVELVPLVSLPLTGAGAAGNRAVAREAAASGAATALGGAPYLDDDPRAALAFLADLATEFGLGLDLHVDETLDPRCFTLPDLIDLARSGFPQAIVASHCVSLINQPQDVARRVADGLAETGIGVVTLPQTNLYLQARSAHGPTARGVPPLELLIGAGVAVGVGGDNVRDPFNPLGRSDPLESAALAVAAAHLAPRDAFDAVTTGARAALGLPPAGPVEGALADLVILPARTTGEAVAVAPASRTVVRRGRVVAESVRTASLTVAERTLR